MQLILVRLAVANLSIQARAWRQRVSQYICSAMQLILDRLAVANLTLQARAWRQQVSQLRSANQLRRFRLPRYALNQSESSVFTVLARDCARTLWNDHSTFDQLIAHFLSLHIAFGYVIIYRICVVIIIIITCVDHNYCVHCTFARIGVYCSRVIVQVKIATL